MPCLLPCLLLLLMSCTADPVSPEVGCSDNLLGSADAVAAADLDGDGFDDAILVSRGVARWGEQQVDLGGSVQQVARGDVDDDGLEEALLATGMSRGQPDAPARLWAIGSDGAELLWERRGERNQVTDLRWVGRIWLAAFSDARRVEAGWLDAGVFTAVSSGALALQHLPWGQDVLVGRIYGDEPRSDGDLVRVGPDGSRQVLPSLRGVRDLELADLDGDGADELLVSDGWHYAYGKQAVARVQLLRGPDWSESRTIGFFPGEYTVDGLQVHGAGLSACVLARGNDRVHLLQRDALGWRDMDLGPVVPGGNAVFFQQEDGLRVLLPGEPSHALCLKP